MKKYIEYRNLSKVIGWNLISILTHKKEENVFKLMNNAVYGKTMGNLKKRINIRVTKISQDFIKYTSRPSCVNWKAFKNNLATTLRS